MKLKYIKTSKCPHCGAITRSEKIGESNANGLQREFREFKCGLVIEFSPNFKKESELRVCPNSKANKKIKKNRKIACTKLWNYINKLTIDNEFKRKLRREVNYLKP